MLSLFKTQLGRLRILAFMEGISFLVILFITMPLKYIFKMPEPNKVFGLAHGVLFVLYVLAVVQIKIEQNWKISTTFWALVASVVPFGTFWADKKIFQVIENKIIND
jgi:integral membrane protein